MSPDPSTDPSTADSTAWARLSDVRSRRRSVGEIRRRLAAAAAFGPEIRASVTVLDEQLKALEQEERALRALVRDRSGPA